MSRSCCLNLVWKIQRRANRSGNQESGNLFLRRSDSRVVQGISSGGEKPVGMFLDETFDLRRLKLSL